MVQLKVRGTKQDIKLSKMKSVFLILILLNLSVYRLFAGDSIDKVDKNIEIIKLTDRAYLMQSSYSCNGHLDCNHLLISPPLYKNCWLLFGMSNFDVSFINTSTALLITKITTLSPFDWAAIPKRKAFQTVSASPELIIIPISGVRDLLNAETFSQPENSCALLLIDEIMAIVKAIIIFLMVLFFGC